MLNKSLVNSRKVAVCCFIIGIFLNSCSFERMFYYPDRVLSDQDRADSLGFQKINFPSRNGNMLNGYWVEAKDSVFGSILFLHGNAGDINDRIESLEILRRGGFNILIFDYQGFGKSQGEVSHQNLVDDAESALLYLENLNKEKKLPLIILGRSIGGHLAVKITHDHQEEVNAMVIEGAFTNHHQIAVQISPFFIQPFAELLVVSKYKASELIKDIKIPKLIIHSTQDETIPYWMGVELYKKAIEPKVFWQIKGCHICGLNIYREEYTSRIKRLLATDIK